MNWRQPFTSRSSDWKLRMSVLTLDSGGTIRAWSALFLLRLYYYCMVIISSVNKSHIVGRWRCSFVCLSVTTTTPRLSVSVYLSPTSTLSLYSAEGPVVALCNHLLLGREFIVSSIGAMRSLVKRYMLSCTRPSPVVITVQFGVSVSVCRL